MAETKAPLKTVNVKQNIPSAVLAAIESNDIAAFDETVQIRESGVEIPFKALFPLTEAGLRALFGGQIDALRDDEGNPKRAGSACGSAAYGYNLIVRASIRSTYLNEAGAPEKTFEKRVKALQDALNISEEQAREMVKNRPE